MNCVRTESRGNQVDTMNCVRTEGRDAYGHNLYPQGAQSCVREQAECRKEGIDYGINDGEVSCFG